MDAVKVAVRAIIRHVLRRILVLMVTAANALILPARDRIAVLARVNAAKSMAI